MTNKKIEQLEPTPPKKRGNPNWIKGQLAPGQGRPQEGIQIKDITTTIKKITGDNFEVLLAHHLNSTREAYESGKDYRSYTTLLMSIMDRVVQHLPKEVKMDVSGTVNHTVEQLQQQEQNIYDKLLKKGYTTEDIIAVALTEPDPIQLPLNDSPVDSSNATDAQAMPMPKRD